MQHAQSQVKTTNSADASGAVAEEDAFRVHLYRIISHFLSGPPSEDDLSTAAAMTASRETPIGAAVLELADAAQSTNAKREAEAYQDLFIGLGRGILVPYGSYYLTGFLHEKPLARLRTDMELLGIARADGVSEPEDHIASVMEMMSGLIAGDFGPVSADTQKRFFEAHVGSWAQHFLRDLSMEQTSAFYAALGALGTCFMEVEERVMRLG